MSLSDQERERYRRQLLLAEVGGQGQQALKSASILVVGAGGLGCPIVTSLAAAGVGRIGICDGDVVEMSNLNRQTLYTEGDIGQPKAQIAKDRLSTFNPHIDVIAIVEMMDAKNVSDLIAGYDLVVEGLDRYAHRFTLNQACIASRKPWISSAVGRMTGQVAMFDPRSAASPCYRCFVPEAPTDEALCETEGILGTTVAVTGHLAANEAVKMICGIDPLLTGALLVYDGTTGVTRRVGLARDPNCRACGER